MIGGAVSFIGVASDLEASGNLIDTLDAYGDAPGVILVNIAPRNGTAKKWKNGTPFGYFWYKKILVVSSVDGLTLSLIKKLGLIDVVHVLDIPTATQVLVKEGALSAEQRDYIINTQFRSFDFLPQIAAYLLKHTDVVSEPHTIADITDAPSVVWWIDNFGNCKTTLLKSEIGENDRVETIFGTLPYFERLADVPDDTPALITGSSGIDTRRFLEVVVQGKSAAEILTVATGSGVLRV